MKYCSSALADNDAVEKLQKELDNVYRLKAINDQQLIDTNNKLATVEKKLQEVSFEWVYFYSNSSFIITFRRDELFAKILSLQAQLEDANVTIKDLTECKTLISDELIALHVGLNV